MTSIIRIDGQRELNRKLTRLERQVFPRALSVSVNNVARTVRTEAARDISKATGLKQSTVKRRVVIRKKANPQDPSAIIQATGRPLNLIEFGARQLKRGGVSAKPWGRRQKFKGAFIATMPNGSEIVVKQSRVGKKIQRGPNKGRAALEAMFGPGIANEASEPALDRARRRVVSQRLPIELENQLKFRVGKLK